MIFASSAEQSASCSVIQLSNTGFAFLISMHSSHIETGNSVPSLKTLIDIINALDCSADELLCIEIKKAKPVFDSWMTEQLADCSADMADVRDHHADLIGQLFLRHALCKAAGTDAFSDVGVVHHNTSPLRFVK